MPSLFFINLHFKWTQINIYWKKNVTSSDKGHFSATTAGIVACYHCIMDSFNFLLIQAFFHHYYCCKRFIYMYVYGHCSVVEKFLHSQFTVPQTTFYHFAESFRILWRFQHAFIFKKSHSKWEKLVLLHKDWSTRWSQIQIICKNVTN